MVWLVALPGYGKGQVRQMVDFGWNLLPIRGKQDIKSPQTKVSRQKVSLKRAGDSAAWPEAGEQTP